MFSVFVFLGKLCGKSSFLGDVSEKHRTQFLKSFLKGQNLVLGRGKKRKRVGERDSINNSRHELHRSFVPLLSGSESGEVRTQLHRDDVAGLSLPCCNISCSLCYSIAEMVTLLHH